VALRFGNVYGPGSVNKGSVVAKFIRNALRGDVLSIYGDGSQTRDFIYIDDLVRAIVMAAEKEEAVGEVFQIATSIERTVSEMVTTLVGILKDFNIKDICVEHSHKRTGDVQRNYSDISKANSLLGWHPQTELDEGLRATVEYFIGGREK
jgi:UDP-glucose 4-epimerase